MKKEFSDLKVSASPHGTRMNNLGEKFKIRIAFSGALLDCL